jgi:predicted restriction endonuclease
VLDAPHIQSYLGPRSDQIRNGLVRSKELHTVFDLCYVGIDPNYKVHVSLRLYEKCHNGRRLHEYRIQGSKITKISPDK